MLFITKIIRKLGIKTKVTKDEIIDAQNKIINGYQDKLNDAEEILNDLAYGYQSRRMYNELIRRANEYGEKYYGK